MKALQNQDHPSRRTKNVSKKPSPLSSWSVFWLVLAIFLVIVAVICIILFYYIFQNYWQLNVFQSNYPVTPEFSPPDFVTQLSEHQAIWASKNITHYRMSLFLPYASSGFGRLSDPLSVEVKAGIVTSVIDGEGNQVPITQDEFASDKELLTVPGLFRFIAEIFDQKPVSLQVWYDPVLGYPSSIDVDPYSEPCCQDYSIIVKDLQVLSP